MSPRGAPDYSNVRAFGHLHRLDDMAELAARLGSAAKHDRSGNVILIDSFENGKGMWGYTPPIGDGSYEVSASRHRTGNFSLRIVPISTDDYALRVLRYAPYFKTDSIGMEGSFTLTPKTDYVEFRLRIYDGDFYHRCDIRYDNTNQKIWYLGNTPGWTVLEEDVKLLKSDRIFHTLKLTVNLNNKQFARVVLNSQEWAYLELDYPVVGSEIEPYIMAQYAIWAKDSSQPEHYFDDLILTQNES